MFCTVKTLYRSKEALDDLGCDVSRSSLYLYLLPRNVNTIERKKHVLHGSSKADQATEQSQKETARQNVCS